MKVDMDQNKGDRQMSFYEELSRVYDIVFPAEEKTINFLIKNNEKSLRVLDIACGTGSYSAAIAKLGYVVDGVDIDTNMINIAKKDWCFRFKL